MTHDKLIYASAARGAILRADPRLSYLIDNIKGVDVKPVVHAHWIVLDDDFYGKAVYCSNCHEHFMLGRGTSVEIMRERQKFCFNCGAYMDEEVGDV